MAEVDVIHVPTMSRYPASCDRNACQICGPKRAYGAAQCAAASRPERMVTLTGAVGNWQVDRARVNHLAHTLRRAGRDWQLFWAIEENPKGTGYHIHGVQHGQYIPHSELQRDWGSICFIEAVDVEVEASRYVVKCAAAPVYVTKGTTADHPAHLARNGGRPEHHTRRYMRLATGEPQTLTAMRLAYGRSSHAPGGWITVPAHTAISQADAARLLTARLLNRHVAGR